MAAEVSRPRLVSSARRDPIELHLSPTIGGHSKQGLAVNQEGNPRQTGSVLDPGFWTSSFWNSKNKFL